MVKEMAQASRIRGPQIRAHERSHPVSVPHALTMHTHKYTVYGGKDYEEYVKQKELFEKDAALISGVATD